MTDNIDEPTGGVPDWLIPDKAYDVLKWVAMLILPAVSTFMLTLGQIWGIPYASEIAATVTAIGTAIGAVIGMSALRARGSSAGAKHGGAALAALALAVAVSGALVPASAYAYTVKWVGSPNFTDGNYSKTCIVDHWMAGTLEGTDSWFSQRRSGVSATYGVADGDVHQYVEERDAAWHAGSFAYNKASIGIEHEGWPGHAPTAETIETSAQLHADIARRYGMGKLVIGKNVYLHSQIVSTSCPGELQVRQIVNRANEINGYWADGSPEGGGGASAVTDLGDTSWTGPKMVRELQRQLGTPADGRISGQTAYNAYTVQWAVTVSPAERPYPGSQVVAALQRKLASWGYGVGAYGFDGHMGHDTVRALQRALNDKLGAGLAVDGYYGTDTSRAVGTALSRGLFR